MLLPVPKIESQQALEEALDDLVLFVKEQKLFPQEERKHLFTIGLLRTLAGCALDVVARDATSDLAREATCTALIRNVARQVALTLGFEMKNSR